MYTFVNVRVAMISSNKLTKSTIHTIASDNGKDFSLHQLIGKELNANFCYARPYYAWE